MKNPEHKHRKKARALLNRHGYRQGGHVTTAEKNAIIRAVHEHERHEHPGKPLTKLKLKAGGAAKGRRPQARADKPHRAAGGRNPKKGHQTKIIIVNGGGQQQARPVPVPVPPRPMPAPPPAGGPPMPAARPPMPMAPPQGLPMRPGMAKRGGAQRKRGGAAKGPEARKWQQRIKGAGLREEREENEGHR